MIRTRSELLAALAAEALRLHPALTDMDTDALALEINLQRFAEDNEVLTCAATAMLCLHADDLAGARREIINALTGEAARHCALPRGWARQTFLRTTRATITERFTMDAAWA